MPRKARIVVPDQPHHITQRGNRGAPVFLEPEDQGRYMSLLADYCGRQGIEVMGWCLMPNHVHLVLVPPSQEALGMALRPLHMRYSQHLNWRLGSGGLVWQGRFYSCVLDEGHCQAALRYVEQNPLRAGLVERAEDWLWSSAAGHCGLRDEPLLSERFIADMPADGWRDLLALRLEGERESTLRYRTYSGLPCGDAAFMAQVSGLVGRELVVRGRGRPRRGDAESA